MVQIHSAEAPRNNYSGGIRDRPAVDLPQLGLVLITRAVARALDQIEVIPREPSPETPEIRPQDE
jgi:hypothetical protein